MLSTLLQHLLRREWRSVLRFRIKSNQIKPVAKGFTWMDKQTHTTFKDLHSEEEQQIPY